jgi:hypothetical protein
MLVCMSERVLWIAACRRAASALCCFHHPALEIGLCAGLRAVRCTIIAVGGGYFLARPATRSQWIAASSRIAPRFCAGSRSMQTPRADS